MDLIFARRGCEDIKEAISLLLDEDRVAIAGPIQAELFQGARDIEEKQNIKDYEPSAPSKKVFRWRRNPLK